MNCEQCQSLKERIEELECQIKMVDGYWELAKLNLGEEKSEEIRIAVNRAALTG